MNQGVKETSVRIPERVRAFWEVWWSSLALLPLCVYFSVSYGDYTFMDAIDLAVHETGHLVFAMFGEFIRMAGGSLFQLLVPAAIVFFQVRWSNAVGTQLGLIWLGQSFLNVSVYAADARARALPLVGGSNVIHDWHYLLGRTGFLAFDTEIGIGLALMGFLLFLVSLSVPRWPL